MPCAGPDAHTVLWGWAGRSAGRHETMPCDFIQREAWRDQVALLGKWKNEINRVCSRSSQTPARKGTGREPGLWAPAPVTDVVPCKACETSTRPGRLGPGRLGPSRPQLSGRRGPWDPAGGGGDMLTPGLARQTLTDGPAHSSPLCSGDAFDFSNTRQTAVLDF